MKLKAVELVNALTAHFEQLNVLTQTSVNVNQNVVKAELGNFLLFASFVDAFGVQDTSTFELVKALTDEAGFAEAIDTVAFGKVIGEYGYVLDDQRFSFAKSLFDQMAATDSNYLGFAKVLTDAVSGISDHSARGTGKALSDAPVASDTVYSFGVTKPLTDAATFTDDIDGAASILDDQEMQFRKIKSNIASAAETFTRQVGYNRLFSDNSIASETHYVVTGKHLSDTPVATETLAKSLTRQRSDSALFGDASVVTSGKVLLNLASSTDAGSLRSQGYTDFTYFAEDFVGASTTF